MKIILKKKKYTCKFFFQNIHKTNHFLFLKINLKTVFTNYDFKVNFRKPKLINTVLKNKKKIPLEGLSLAMGILWSF